MKISCQGQGPGREAPGRETSRRWILISLGLAGLMSLHGGGCTRGERVGEEKEPAGARPEEAAAPSAPLTAQATIAGRSGAGVTGRATFTEVESGVKVVVEIQGASPGRHGVHLHDKGDCSAPDAKSAGSHFNPDSSRHGEPHGLEHHAGDFGNLEVGSDGSGRLDLIAGKLTVHPGPHSVIGRSIIIHARPDNFSQPDGNAGDRIGCGTIQPSS